MTETVVELDKPVSVPGEETRTDTIEAGKVEITMNGMVEVHYDEGPRGTKDTFPPHMIRRIKER